MYAYLYAPHSDEAEFLTLILQKTGYQVRLTRNLDQVVSNWSDQPADFIIATLGRNFEAEVQYFSQLRSFTIIPIVVIVDFLTEEDQVKLFEIGTDLVIMRPYSSRLLFYQVRALARRSASIPYSGLPSLDQSGIVLNPATHTASVYGNESQHLTQLEFRLLYTMMIHAGQIMPTENLVESVWGYTGDSNRELVRGLIQRVRGKIEPDPHNPSFILTEPGIGYYFKKDAN